eukprot:10633396-Alexandrium_andersonii.AAC.1
MTLLLQAYRDARPHLWTPMPALCRFLDDLFGFWNGAQDDLVHFVADLNDWSRAHGWGVQFELACVGDPTHYLDVE